MKKIFFLSIILFVRSAFAQTSALSFLSVDVGTRTAAMGGAPRQFLGSAFFSNAASVAGAEATMISIEHRAWAPDAGIEAIGVVIPNDVINVGVNAMLASDRNITLRQRAGDATGMFSSVDASFALSAAVKVTDDVAVGSTAKFLLRRIYIDEATAFLFDVGAFYAPTPNLKLGAVLANLGRVQNLQSDQAIESSSLDVAGEYSLKNISSDIDMNVAARTAFPLKKDDRVHFYSGAEGVYKHRLSLRAGYATGFETIGFTTGIGFRAFESLSVDYAFLPSREVSRHSIGVSFGF